MVTTLFVIVEVLYFDLSFWDNLWKREL